MASPSMIARSHCAWTSAEPAPVPPAIGHGWSWVSNGRLRASAYLSVPEGRTPEVQVVAQTLARVGLVLDFVWADHVITTGARTAHAVCCVHLSGRIETETAGGDGIEDALALLRGQRHFGYPLGGAVWHRGRGVYRYSISSLKRAVVTGHSAGRPQASRDPSPNRNQYFWALPFSATSTSATSSFGWSGD